MRIIRSRQTPSNPETTMNSKLFDLEELDFEVAIETIGRLLAMQSEKIHREESRAHADKRKIRKYSRSRQALQDRIGKLYAGDKTILQKVAAIYSKAVDRPERSSRI
jgi:predicted DNA-binding helix-hairpin-helix protein